VRTAAVRVFVVYELRRSPRLDPGEPQELARVELARHLGVDPVRLRAPRDEGASAAHKLGPLTLGGQCRLRRRGRRRLINCLGRRTRCLRRFGQAILLGV
jgi:hypothetical protein